MAHPVRAVLLVGLPGSGKTTLARERYLPEGFILVDDPTDIDDVREAVAAARAVDGPGIIVADPHLVVSRHRQSAETFLVRLGCTVEFVFFANDPDQAEINVRMRADDRGPMHVRVMSQAYDLPEGEVTIPVHRPRR